MPSKYTVRQYEENGIYHIYNRGVEKRTIFLDEQDYRMFLYYLFIYLSPLDEVLEKYSRLPLRLHSKNLLGSVTCLTFCLMPNHFHLVLQIKDKDGIHKLLKQVMNGYTLYFNNKYNRVGGLMQGRYKAVQVTTDEQLLHLSRYIHLNPVVAGIVASPALYEWSSYNHYVSGRLSTWVVSDAILSHFPSRAAYEKFVADQIAYAKELHRVKHLLLED